MSEESVQLRQCVTNRYEWLCGALIKNKPTVCPTTGACSSCSSDKCNNCTAGPIHSVRSVFKRLSMDFIQSQWNSFLGEFKGMNARQLIGQGTNLGNE